jgi:hypothetical protein
VRCVLHPAASDLLTGLGLRTPVVDLHLYGARAVDLSVRADRVWGSERVQRWEVSQTAGDAGEYLFRHRVLGSRGSRLEAESGYVSLTEVWD